MNFIFKWICGFICCFALLLACERKATKQSAHKKFEVVEIPAMLTSPEERIKYMVEHYWERFDFSDTSYLSMPDVVEGAFLDFLNLLPHTSIETARKGLETMMHSAAVDSLMFNDFYRMSENLLYKPTSPLRNDEYFIEVLQAVILSKDVAPINKIRPQYQLDMALKNRIDSMASDFVYTTVLGKKSSLFAAKGEYIVLVFYNPDCPACSDIKEYIKAQGIDRRATVVFVNPDVDTHLQTDELYDLKAIPTLYLLDKEKKVLLKDVSIEQINAYVPFP
ncbi:MAG: DUF5106 domain-containing protein [Odoribacter sp.]